MLPDQTIVRIGVRILGALAEPRDTLNPLLRTPTAFQFALKFLLERRHRPALVHEPRLHEVVVAGGIEIHVRCHAFAAKGRPDGG